MNERILVVDDEEIIRDSIGYILEKEGYKVSKAANGAVAYEMLSRTEFDLVITDIEMPQLRGIELLEKISVRSPQTFVIIITAYASIETAIEALRKGAFDYILKPIEFDDMLLRVKKLFEHRALAQENVMLRKELNRQYDFHHIIGHSAAMKKVFETIEKVAPSDGTVMITGASGTGKELVARAIHYNSKRSRNRFAAINCGAIVETLFESELFGHKKGAFTGAVADKDGMLKVAEGGTLLLDEISEMPFQLQVKLLRALEQKEITPVGSNDPIVIDVRIIAATNRNLREEVAHNRFREDLFYRLNIVDIHLPRLAEREDDIPLLVSHFIEVFRKQMGKNVKGLTNRAMDMLMRYAWPGQVRELQNVIERAMIFCSDEYIDETHLPADLQQSSSSSNAFSIPSSMTFKDAVHQFERQLIEKKLAHYPHDKEAAAKEFGMSLSTLYRKMEEYKISLHTPKERS